ncbi:MAG TPA: hypothetical protein VIH57_04795 [Bacteroidales bacterium]
MAMKTGEKDLTEEIIYNIRAINSNHVDIYTGNMPPEMIIANMSGKLLDLGISDKPEFVNWLMPQGFQLLTLDDSSVWVIREGVEDEWYIHFHPARNSVNAIRIQGNSWKTAITAKLSGYSASELSLQVINDIRKNTLEISPVKDLRKSHGLRKAFELLG